MMGITGVMRLLESFEGYLAINFLMDAMLIGAVARANDCFSLSRVLLAAAVAAGCAGMANSFLPGMKHPAFQILLMLPIAMIVSHDPNFWRWGAFALQLLAATTLLGGLGFLFAPSGGWWQCGLMGLGLYAIALAFRARGGMNTAWVVTVIVFHRGKQARFRALIDTGNRLREPMSGLPVLIVEEELLAGLDLARERFRSVPFGGLGGGGEVRCFRPEMVMTIQNGRLRQTADVYVALYPGAIPGPERALAPPCFALVRGWSGEQERKRKGVRL